MYICSTCHYSTPIKLGKCPECNSFGSIIKDPTQTASKKSKATHGTTAGKTLTGSNKKKISKRFSLEHKELLRVFPKGVKGGGLYLLGGEPGIGKSTLMLQIIDQLQHANQLCTISYFSGEEDDSQIYDRKSRIDPKKKESGDGENSLGKKMFHVHHATHLEDILTTAESINTDILIIDSIQTIYTPSHDSVSGSPAQVKRCSEKISERCKKKGVTCFLIGHVTKGGEIAGPKYLEHIVDVVLYLEGERFGNFRFLRTQKNRFGPTDEVGIFEMGLFGLQPVYNLKDRIIQQANINIPGNVLTVAIDNGRPVLINLEALLNKSNGKFPQRVSQGIDSKRLQIVIAIIERYLKINLSYFDIYVNIPGEFQFRDTGLDLALAAAIYSQAKNIIIDKELIFVGELGLGGQVIQSKLHSKRVKEMEGFHVIDQERIKYISELPHVF